MNALRALTAHVNSIATALSSGITTCPCTSCRVPVLVPVGTLATYCQTCVELGR